MLPLFPTTSWTLGSQNVIEARNPLPPSPTVAGVTPEGTDPALESDPVAAEVMSQKGEAPASERDSRVRRQAEPGDAAYVAADNSLTAKDGDVTVPGRLVPVLSQPSATLAAARGAAEETGPTLESHHLAAGMTPPEDAAPASAGDPEVTGQAAQEILFLQPRGSPTPPERGKRRRRDTRPRP